jgi:hypothetical protein
MLLAVYALVPIALALIAVDVLFLERWLQSVLPTDPDTMPVFPYLFVLPHIVSSTVILLDRAYLAHFGRRLAMASAALFILAIGTQYGPFRVVLFSLFNLFTVYHVAQQQFGITRMLCRSQRWEHPIWSWSGVFLMASVLLSFYAKVLDIDLHVAFLPLVTLVTAPLFLWASIRLHQHSKRAIGTGYLWSNTLLVGFTLVSYWSGYAFFMLLLPRLIHDYTAYVFYTVHDTNRNASAPHNILFRNLRFTRLPTTALTLIVGVVLAAPITANMGFVNVRVLFIYLTMLHYYTEGITWKSGSPYRANI